MSETYPEQLNRMEHEKALPAGKEMRQEIAERALARSRAEQDPVVAVAEARKNVAETTSTIPQHDALKQLEEAENEPQDASVVGVDRELRQFTKQRELQHIQRKLSAPQRVLSRIIHQPVVSVTSEALGKTISRPSGLLGGGLVAFLGTSGYLFMARYLGFPYNYTIFLVLFFGGFALGLILELVMSLATASRRQSD